MVSCPACGESSPDRARFCLSCGQQLAPTGSAEVRRNITVIFADLVGSTAIGERYDAEIVRRVTGQYFEGMRAMVERHEGTVEKFIGDAVVALFGVPRVREDDAMRGVRAAIEMQAEVQRLNTELDRDLGVTIQARIGVNTGEVVVGDPRAGGTFTTGDAMNLAARLEQAAAPGEILIGDLTERLVRGAVQVEALEPLPVKGKADPVIAWRLIDVSPDRHDNRSGDDPFIGRARPLMLLSEALDRVARTAGCELVTVVGDAGIGKSRLAQEFISSATSAAVLTGHCLSYGQGATYWPLREAILGAIGLAGDEPADTVEAALLEMLAGQAEAIGIVSTLLPLLVLTHEEAVPEAVDWAVRRLLEALAERQPVVLLLDDLHWAEPGLLEVIDHLLGWSHDAPLLIVGLTRPELEDRPPAVEAERPNVTTIRLSGLDRAEVGHLIERHDLPDAVRRRLVETADGNPLFLQQLVAMLVDQAYATMDSEIEMGRVTWVTGSPVGLDLAMPPTVSALLTSRIDRLSSELRDLVGQAAVVGAIFYLEALTAISEASQESDCLARLDELSRRGFIHPGPTDLPGLTAYSFDHALIRDAAYEGLTKAGRADLHERLASWLESLGRGIPDEIIGHHLAAAWACRRQLGPLTDQVKELGRGAARRLLSASRRLELTDLVAATQLTTRAVEMLAPEDADWAICKLKLADQSVELGQLDVMRAVLHDVERHGDARSATLARARSCRPQMLPPGGDVALLEDFLEQTVNEFERTADDEALAVCFFVLADLANLRGLATRSGDLLMKALRHGEAAGDRGLAFRARGMVPISYSFGTKPAEEAITTLDELLAAAPYDVRLRAEVEQMTCVMHAMCGRFDEARALARSARRLLTEVGHELFLANFAQSSGHVEDLAGDLPAAIAEHARSQAELEALGDKNYLSTVAAGHARLLAHCGDYQAARKAIAVARSAGSADDAATYGLIFQAEALVRCAAGDANGARAAVADGRELLGGLELPDDLGELHRAGALVERTLNDRDRERRHLVTAREIFAAKGNVVRAGQAERRLAELST